MIFNIILSIIFLVVCFKSDRDILAPGVIFFAVWSLIFIAYKINLFDYYDVSNHTVVVLFVMVTSFFLGIQSEKFLPKLLINRMFGLQISRNVKIIMLVGVFIAGMIVLSQNISVVEQVISGAHFWEISAKEKNNTLGVWSAVTVLGAYPLVYFFVPIACYYWFSDKNKLLLMLSIVVVVLSVLDHGGRVALFYFLFVFFSMYHFHGKKEVLKRLCTYKSSKNNRQKWIVLIVALIVIFLIYKVSTLRGVKGIFCEHIYTYLCGCIPFLDIKLNGTQFHTYGGGCFYGVILPFMGILRGLKIINDPEWYIQLTQAVDYQEFTYISPNTMMNAFVTPAYVFYVDFGMAGVFLGLFLFGAYCQRLYFQVKKLGDAKSLCLYSLVSFGLLFSMARFWLALPSGALALIYLYIFFSGGDNVITKKSDRTQSFSLPSNLEMEDSFGCDSIRNNTKKSYDQISKSNSKSI